MNSLMEHINKHIKKINDSDPNDPNRNHWESEILAAIGNIQRELNHMGPNAKKEVLEILKDIFPQIFFH